MDNQEEPNGWYVHVKSDDFQNATHEALMRTKPLDDRGLVMRFGIDGATLVDRIGLGGVLDHFRMSIAFLLRGNNPYKHGSPRWVAYNRAAEDLLSVDTSLKRKG